jgi:hypothetical protein
MSEYAATLNFEAMLSARERIEQFGQVCAFK